MMMSRIRENVVKYDSSVDSTGMIIVVMMALVPCEVVDFVDIPVPEHFDQIVEAGGAILDTTCEVEGRADHRVQGGAWAMMPSRVSPASMSPTPKKGLLRVPSLAVLWDSGTKRALDALHLEPAL